MKHEESKNMREILNISRYENQDRNVVVFGNNALDLGVSEKKFYDIRKNNVREIAGVFLEEGVVGDMRQRINISDLYFESDIEKCNWEYNIHSESEKEATKNIFSLGKQGCNLVVWISPEDEEGVYKEGRLNIEFPVFGDKEWSIYGKHVPLLDDQKSTYDLVQRLIENRGITIGMITDIESIRCQPIGFRIENIDDWIDACKGLMPEFLDIWNFIEKGKDAENKLKMEKEVTLAIERSNGNNYLFENIMAMRGNKINQEGGCGSTWNNNGIGMIVSVNSNGEFTYRLGVTEGLTFCKKCGCWYSGDKCPICH